MPTCSRCGKQILRGRLCTTHQLEAGSAATANEYELFDCPTCDGVTSGEGTRCYKCRGGDR